MRLTLLLSAKVIGGTSKRNTEFGFQRKPVFADCSLWLGEKGDGGQGRETSGVGLVHEGGS